MRRILVTLGMIGAAAFGLVSPASAATQPTYAGHRIVNSNPAYCGSGFIAHSNAGIAYVLTAGHCIRLSGFSNYWVDNNSTKVIGRGVRFDYGGYGDTATRMDAGAIKSISPLASQFQSNRSGAIYNYTGTRNPRVNDVVTIIRSRDTRATATGKVTKINVVVNYSGAGATDNIACVKLSAGAIGPGDSGSAVVIGSVGVGLVSGGDPATGCVYITQLQTVLDRWGLHR